MVGAATTTASLGAAPTAVAAVAALLTRLAATEAAVRLPAVVGFAAAVCWALVWIASGSPAGSVKAAALVAVVAVVLAMLVRLWRASDRSTAAWG